MRELDPHIRVELDRMLTNLDEVPDRWDLIVADADHQARHRVGRRLLSRPPRRSLVLAMAACIVAILVPAGALMVGSSASGTGESSVARAQEAASPSVARSSHDTRPETSDASRLLARVSSVAAAQSEGHSGSVAYLKSRTVFSGTGDTQRPYTFLIPSIRESWIAPDGSGRMKESRARPIFLSKRDRERWVADGTPLPQSGDVDRTFGSLKRWNEDLGLPTEAVALETTLRARVTGRDGGPEAALLTEISDLLAGPATSAALRSALYAVLARFDTVELMGARADAVGRDGMAISVPRDEEGTTRTVLIFDPATSTVLASEVVLVKQVDWIGADPPAVVSSVTYLESGWVDTTEETPAPISRDRTRAQGTAS